MRNTIVSGFDSLVSLTRLRAAHQGERRAYVFLVDGENETDALSYSELDRRSRAIAAKLQQTVAPGARALLLYRPGLDFVTAFIGCLYAGVIAVPTYPPHPARSLRSSIPRLEAIARDAGVSIILGTDAVLRALHAMPGLIPELGGVPSIATEHVGLHEAQSWYVPDIHADTIAFLQYTSGSTAVPKGVMVSHGNLLHNLACIHDAEENDDSCCSVSWLPAQHDMGLIEGILEPLFGNYPAYLMPPTAFLQRPVRWLQAISRYRATNSGAPNFAYELCVRKISPEQHGGLDLSCWRNAYNGSEPIRHDTLARFVEAFANCGFRPTAYRIAYGLAEATLLVSAGRRFRQHQVRTFDKNALGNDEVVEVSHSDRTGVTLVPCGPPVGDTQVIIADPSTFTRKGPGKVGEIWLAGPSIAQGYWNRPEETQHAFAAHLADTREGPFLRTGDMGFLWLGELFITGRIKDVIIVRGRKVYPQDLELTVERSHPLIRPGCAAAFAINDGTDQHLVVAAEIGADARSAARSTTHKQLQVAIGDVRQAIAELHELQVYAVSLLAPGTLPKTSSGKLQRYACKTAFLRGTLQVLAHWIHQPLQMEMLSV